MFHKLLLTSTGLTAEPNKKAFIKLVDKPVAKIKISFVPTAARSEEEITHVKDSFNELLSLGIKEKNIEIVDLSSQTSIDSADVLYVCGGNTFYLLNEFNRYGFSKKINEFVDRGGLYLGVSAGSIVVGPSIKIAEPFDENDVNLVNFSALNIVNFSVSPHFCEEEKEIIESIQKSENYTIYPITDSEAVLVFGDQIAKIS